MEVPLIAPAGTEIGILSAQDQEDDTVIYALTEASALKFSLVHNQDGTYTVLARETLVYEPNQPISFTVTVTDGVNTFEETFQVAFANEAPDVDFDPAEVNEGAQGGTLLGTLPGADQDGDELKYRLSDVSQQFFTVAKNNENGSWEVRVKPGVILDYENAAHRSFSVVVDDGVNPAITETFALDLQDVNESPIVSFAPVPLKEGGRGGTVLGTLSAIDPEGDDVSYELLGDSAKLFDLVERADGRWEVVVLDGVTLDYELATHRSVAVRASDGANALDRNFALNLADLPDILRGTKGGDLLRGAAGEDILQGLSGSDKLFGMTGDDRIYGGLGNDVLSGGKGRDTFVFDTKLYSAKTNKKKNLDRIIDFDKKDDTVRLDNKVFKKLGKKGSETKPAKLIKKYFTAGESAKDKNDYLVYNKKTGVLYYDADGSGKGAAVEIAQLRKNEKVSYSDFFVL
ncbi:calcium-binding protein [Microvirga roseola]|uniref:calcium-binding protein n=1 Tax=Microvirga roseola TaxID=2883126 RepID=UPI001E37430C|nr:hypothetical protein [Microvirga roseola]